jgi:translation elongation factor EF-G
LVGQGGSGKTSLAEAILYFSGVSDRLGQVGDVSSVMDYDHYEDVPEHLMRNIIGEANHVYEEK